MDDVREILSFQDSGADHPPVEDEDGIRRVGRKKGSLKTKEFTPKRPEGMHRELYSLLCADGGKRFDELAPLYPVDHGGGYQKKLKIGARKVRQWKWTPFTNPARKDAAVLYHWKRVTDEPKEYPFAKFNKEPTIVQYSDAEYATHLDSNSGWTRAESDHLLDLCRRFNLRFTVIHDRWDSLAFGTKSMEDLKERYYQISNVISRLRADPEGDPPKLCNYDAEHEKRRKDQLNKLWNRTPEQVEEEEFLRAEIKKIEARKRERDKKTQDLQKLITAADAGSMCDSMLAPPGTPGAPGALNKKHSTDSRRAAILSAKKKTGKALQTLRGRDNLMAGSSAEVFQGIKWPDFKTAGAFVRSQKMKLPGSVGQKKMKALEQILQKLNVDMVQIPTEEIVVHFNELRSDIVLLYELKSMLAACDMEIQSTAHQYEAIAGQKLDIPAELLTEASSLVQSFETGGPGRTASISASSLAASLAVNDLDLPSRKRKAAIEQNNMLKKLKQKML